MTDETTTPEAEQPSIALERHDPSAELVQRGIIHAASPKAILQKAGELAEVLHELITAKKLFADMGGGKKHVEVGAWQACGAMLGALGGEALHAETVWTRPVMSDDGVTARRTTYTAEFKSYKSVDGKKTHVGTTTYDVDGLDWEAKVEVRTASGKVVGSAEGMVGRSESKWAKRDDYALRSMAETRAESRAYRRAIGWIVSMAGYSPTPAEEMPDQPASGPRDGPEADEKLQGQMLVALAYIFDTGEGPNDKLAREAFNKIGSWLNYMPEAVCHSIRLAASVLKRHIGPNAQLDVAPAPAPEEPGEPVEGEAVPDDDDPTDTQPPPPEASADPAKF